jgi:hypothetical protein
MRIFVHLRASVPLTLLYLYVGGHRDARLARPGRGGCAGASAFSSEPFGRLWSWVAYWVILGATDVSIL